MAESEIADGATTGDELDRRLLNITFRYTPTATVGAVLVFAIDYFIYRDSLPPLLLGLWAGALMVAQIGRAGLYMIYRRAPDLWSSATYRTAVTACVLLHGLAWTPMIYGTWNLGAAGSMDAYMVLTVTGMVGAGVGSMAACQVMFATFMAPLAVAVFAMLALTPGHTLAGVALWGVFFAFMLTCSRLVNATLVDAVRSRIRNEDLARELRRLAERDPLTGLFNRRRFDDELESAWIAAGRRGDLVGVLICDVDHFKAYNDTLGHQAGDECLQQIAAVLKQLARRGEGVCARLGGEEFVILLRQVHSDAQLEAVAQRVRQGVEAARLSHPASPTEDRITVSIGAACARPADEHASQVTLMELADQALYRAKQAGRNREMVLRTEGGNALASRTA